MIAVRRALFGGQLMFPFKEMRENCTTFVDIGVISMPWAMYVFSSFNFGISSVRCFQIKHNIFIQSVSRSPAAAAASPRIWVNFDDAQKRTGR